MFRREEREREKKKKNTSMEVGSTIAKAFKRFTIPRSTSAIGSFPASNGTASNNIEISIDEPMPPPWQVPLDSALNVNRHPPLSYVQNIRLNQQHKTDESIPQPHASTPPLRENVSSVMIRSPSADEYTPKKSKVCLPVKTRTKTITNPLFSLN